MVKDKNGHMHKNVATINRGDEINRGDLIPRKVEAERGSSLSSISALADGRGHAHVGWKVWDIEGDGRRWPRQQLERGHAANYAGKGLRIRGDARVLEVLGIGF